MWLFTSHQQSYEHGKKILDVVSLRACQFKSQIYPKHVEKIETVTERKAQRQHQTTR
jgi:hypothetical protein